MDTITPEIRSKVMSAIHSRDTLPPGLADSMQSALNLPVRVADDPQLAVILGAGVVLGELDALARPKAKAPIPWTGLLIFAIAMLSLCKKHGLINRVIDLFVR